MIEITFVDNKIKRFSKATKYNIVDGWYVLIDDDAKEIGRAQASKVRDIAGVSEDESGQSPPVPVSQFSFPQSQLKW